MSVQFEIKLSEDHMYEFLLKHYYTHVGGILTTAAGVASALLAAFFLYQLDFTKGGVWVMSAFIFLYVNRKTLKNKAKIQVKESDMINKPLHCELAESGVIVRRDGETVTNPWEDFTKVYTTKHVVILYVGRVRAFIFPKEQIGEQYQAAVEIIREHIPHRKIRGLK